MAKKIKVFTEEMAIVDNDMYDELSKYRWHLHTGYPARKVKDKTIFMHRLVNQTPEGKFTDHINRNILDNRKDNLRTADKRLNGLNRGVQPNNKSGYKNVCLHKASGLWTVEVKNGAKRVVKYFKTMKEAIIKSKSIRKEVYGKTDAC